MTISKRDLFIAFDNLFKKIPKYKLVVSFSGNKDSVVLTTLLIEWIRNYAPYWNIRLVHFVHGDSRSDLMAAKIAQDFAMENELCFDIQTCHITNEYSGSVFRKEYFTRTVKDDEIVVTGHHLSDSVETTLINLFSGAGPKGASGISEHIVYNQIIFVRPFIAAQLYQEEIDHLSSLLLLDEDVHYVYDEMNLNTQMKRNSIREEILPKIEKTFPNVQEKIFDFSRTMVEQSIANEYLFKVVDSKLSAGQNMYSETLISEMMLENPEVFNIWFFTFFRIKFQLALNKNHLSQFKLFLSRNASICHLPNGHRIIRYSPKILCFTINTNEK